jgi:hypothetical protein
MTTIEKISSEALLASSPIFKKIAVQYEYVL